MRAPSGEDLAALDSIRAAYMALATLPDSNPLARQDRPSSPLDLLVAAFRGAATRAGLTRRQARQLWAVILDSGESTAYAVGYLISHPDTFDY